MATDDAQPGDPADALLRKKKHRLAQLKMEKERLEAELADADESQEAETSKSRPQRKQATASGDVEQGTSDVATLGKPSLEPNPATKTKRTPKPRAKQLPARTVEGRNSERKSTTPPPPPPRLDNASVTEATSIESEEKSGFGVAVMLRASPSWLVSMAVHLILVLVLALFSFAAIQDNDEVFIVANTIEEQPDAFEDLAEFEVQEMEELEVEDLSIQSEIPDPGEITVADLAAVTEAIPSNEVGEIQVPETTIGEIGSLLGKDGSGMSEIGDGLKAAATFFGAKATGRRFVFVVDNSNSMGGGRFETALNELVRSVNQMSPKQSFYVIFFSDTAYPLFHPKPASGFVPASSNNIERLRVWLYGVEMCLRTKGEQAVARALAMNPDVIYILGDGNFTDRAAQILTAPHQRRTVIHTVGMEVNERGARELTAIAKANKGKFRKVAATPESKKMAKTNPIKKNRTYGKVWGIELPAMRKQ